MSETTIGACPVCGAGAQMIHAGPWVGCNACDMIAPPAAWNRLSRAAALLRAVEALETAVQERYDPDASGSILLDDRFISGGLTWGEVQYGPLDEALIDLAQQIGAPHAD
jgi:hypothetical protein